MHCNKLFTWNIGNVLDGGFPNNFSKIHILHHYRCVNHNISATCYGLKAASHYDRDVINYGHLAKDVKNIESLGNQACAEAPACFRQVKAAMEVRF